MVKKAAEGKVLKVGDDLSVSIPSDIIKDMGLQEGDAISIQSGPGALVLTKKDERTTHDFAKMMKEVTDKNDEAMRRLADR